MQCQSPTATSLSQHYQQELMPNIWTKQENLFAKHIAAQVNNIHTSQLSPTPEHTRKGSQAEFTSLFNQFQYWSNSQCTATTGHRTLIIRWLTSFVLTIWRPLLPYMSTAIKHPVPDMVKPSFVIFDICALWCSALSIRVPGCQKLQMMA